VCQAFRALSRHRQAEDDFGDFGDVVGLCAEVDDAGAEGEFAVDDGVR